ncbi:phosphodiesterase [Pantoea septica]|uniref:phosphodiesterase n=1 Tax=Pantoea septica TaxID=472695 RepID=UPI00289BD07C|nr:phosphodiesterase [Pantoea septica]
MEIISHRGYWKSPQEKNSLVAFERSFNLGFGTETDVRDYQGDLVISHDIPVGGEMPLSDFLKLVDGESFSLALNIKSDGLTEKLADCLSRYNIPNAFVFDMSVPDQLSYYRNGKISFFSRASEYEPKISLFEECHGVWLDAFISTWYDVDYIKKVLDVGKKVCIVSSELHKREDYYTLWSMLAHPELRGAENLILCTDMPEDAQRFFAEAK